MWKKRIKHKKKIFPSIKPIPFSSPATVPNEFLTLGFRKIISSLSHPYDFGEWGNPRWNDFKSHRLFPFSMSGFACLESWFDSDDHVVVQKQEAVRSKTHYAWCLQMSRVPDGTRFACCMLCSIHSIQLFIRLYLRGCASSYSSLDLHWDSTS